MYKKTIMQAGVCLSLISAVAHAQNFFVLPGANSPGSSVQVYTSQFIPLTTFQAGVAAYQIIAKPDGSKYYVISNAGSQTVTEVDNTFQNPKSLGNLGTQATAAALTPDGKRLLVVAGTLHVFDTTTDAELPASTLPGTPLSDLAISLDGTRAFVLGTLASGQGVLYAIDLTGTSFNVVGNLPLNNITTGVAVGPNGLVYVGAVNRVYEINPATLALTSAGEIGTIIKAGHLAFTPDGRYLLVPNLTPGQSSATVDLIDLLTHTVTATSANIANGTALFDRILVASNTLAYAYSSQTSTLYQLTIPGLVVNPTNFSGINNLTVSSASLSNDVPGGTHPSAQFLYLVAGGNAYKIDTSTNQVVSTAPVTIAQGGVITATNPTLTNTTPVSFVSYGNNQALAQGATSLPLVVRVLDANNLPISGVLVTFASTNTGVTFQNATVTSGVNGYAATTITAPSTSGPAIITATAGSATATFTLTVGTTGGGTPSGGLSIVAGQGQLVFPQTTSRGSSFALPLSVRVTDINGKPVPTPSVTFTVTSGSITLQDGTATPDGLGTVVVGDATGLASVDYLSSLAFGTDFVQTTIQASAPGTNTVTFYITTTNQFPQPTVQFKAPQPGTTLSGSVGSVIKGAVQVVAVASSGRPIPNLSVRLLDPQTYVDPISSPDSMFAKCADSTGLGVLTDSTGTGTCDLVFTGSVPSGQQLQVITDVGYHFVNLNGPINLAITPGVPSKITVVTGNTQSGRPGQALPGVFAVQVTDAAGNPLSGVPVAFQVVTPGTITLSNVSTTTDQNGRATANGTLGNTAGTYQLKVTAGTVSTTFSFTVTIPAAGIQAVSGTNQVALINTTFGAPLIVKVVDTSGAAVAGIPVSFAISSGSATLLSPSAATDATGQAQTQVNAGPSAGPIVITATAGGFSTSFALTSRLPGPTNVAFVNGASFQAGISPGSIITIQGTGLLPGVTGLVRPFNIVGPLPTSLSGFSVTFNGIPAPVFFASNQNGQEQVGVQVPFEIAPGTAAVAITAAGGGTATIPNVPVQAVAPGVFETTYNGQNFVVAIRPDGSYVSPTNPAQRGEVDCAFATGLGQVNPTIATNSAGTANQNVTASIDFGLNNGGVRLVSATTLPGAVGVYQLCFQVPSDTTQGPRQPVGLIVHDPSGDFFANGSFIAIQ